MDCAMDLNESSASESVSSVSDGAPTLPVDRPLPDLRLCSPAVVERREPELLKTALMPRPAFSRKKPREGRDGLRLKE